MMTLSGDFEHQDDPRMKYLLPALKQQWASSQARFEKEFEETRESSPAVTRKFLDMVKAMKAAGVRLLAGTDTPAHPFVWPGFSLHEELQWLVKAGLTPVEALQTATLNPARYLAKEKELGTVERGQTRGPGITRCQPVGRHPQHAEDQCRRGEWQIYGWSGIAKDALGA